MQILCNVITESYLFSTNSIEIFSEIKLKFANSIIAQTMHKWL